MNFARRLSTLAVQIQFFLKLFIKMYNRCR